MSGDDVVARARTLIGAAFRPGGRDPAFGLDCVGVVASAVGQSAPAAIDEREADAIAALAAAGLGPVHGRNAPGDVVLCRPAPRRLHLIVLTDFGFVHADAGLRRVVERPGEPPWPVVAVFRGKGE